MLFIIKNSKEYISLPSPCTRRVFSKYNGYNIYRYLVIKYKKSMRKSIVKQIAKAILSRNIKTIKIFKMYLTDVHILLEEFEAKKYGDQKYGKDNWKKIKWNNKARRIYAAATARHLIRATYPGRTAQDTHIDHLGHALSNINIILWMETHKNKVSGINMKEIKGKRDILKELGI